MNDVFKHLCNSLNSLFTNTTLLLLYVCCYCKVVNIYILDELRQKVLRYLFIFHMLISEVVETHVYKWCTIAYIIKTRSIDYIIKTRSFKNSLLGLTGLCIQCSSSPIEIFCEVCQISKRVMFGGSSPALSHITRGVREKGFRTLRYHAYGSLSSWICSRKGTFNNVKEAANSLAVR